MINFHCFFTYLVYLKTKTSLYRQFIMSLINVFFLKKLFHGNAVKGIFFFYTFLGLHCTALPYIQTILPLLAV